MGKFTPQIQENNSSAGFFFLALYTAAVFIRPQEWSQNGFEFPIMRVFLIISFLLYLVSQKPKNWGPQGWCLIGLTGVIILSGLRNGWLSGGFISANDFFIASIIPFLLFSSLVYDKAKIKQVFIIILFSTFFMLHHGYSQVSSPIGMGWSGLTLSQGTRITYLGFFNDPNDLGMFFVMSIPLALFFYGASKKFMVKTLSLLLVSLLIWGIYKTNSRGTLLGGLSLFGLYALFKYGKFKAGALILLCIPLLMLVMSQFREIDSNEESADQRIEAWYTAVVLFKTHPFVGVMKGNFTEYHHLTAHNSYALVMAELGSIGYMFWFSFLVITLLKLYKIAQGGIAISPNKQELWQQEGPEYLALAKTLLFSLTGFAVTAFFLSRSYVIVLFLFVGVATALISLIERNFIEKSEVEKTNKSVIKQSVVLSMVSLVGLYFVVKVLI